MRCISSVSRPSAPMTTATGLPKNARLVKASTCLNRYVDIPSSGWSSNTPFLAHGARVPQIDEVAVGVAQLGTVPPREFLRCLLEMQASLRELPVFRFDVVDLEREGTRSGNLFRGALREEQSKISIVLEPDGMALGDVDLDLEAEVLGVPLARPGAVADGDRKVIEANHRTLLPRAATIVAASVRSP